MNPTVRPAVTFFFAVGTALVVLGGLLMFTSNEQGRQAGLLVALAGVLMFGFGVMTRVLSQR